jgi:threonyl-tRNA synthetase
MQLDFSMPERLGAQYVGQDNSRQTPVMLHRATLGTIERFIGILLEHYADGLPLWLAPTQVAILTITDKHDAYAIEIQKMMEFSTLRVTTDLRNEKISYKIREHTIKRVPYLLILGDKEVSTKTATLRNCAGEDLGAFALTDLINRLQAENGGMGH